jgi:putative ABC transport system substrate-binding protein
VHFAVSHAQQAAKIRRVGVVLALSEQDAEIQARIAGFRKELERLGWQEGRNLHVEYRWAAADPNLKGTYVAELVAQEPDLTFAAPTSMAVEVLLRIRVEILPASPILNLASASRCRHRYSPAPKR